MKYLIQFFLAFIPLSMTAQNIGVRTGTPSTLLDVNGSVAFREGTALTLSNGANNDIALADYSFFRVTGPTAAFTVTGFTNGTDGRALTLVNATGQTMTLGNQTTSSPTNQIKTGNSSVILSANGVATLIYNANLGKWIVSSTIGDTPSFTNITTGTLTDSLLVTNNGTPFKVRPVDFVETYAWGLDGNANTTAGTHFVGTTNAQDLVFKTNNTEGMRLTTNQTLGIGTTTPLSTARLHVENTVTNHAVYAPIATNYNYFAGKTAFGRATNNPTTTFLGASAEAFIHLQDSITSLNSAVVTEGVGVKLKIVPTAASTGGVYGVNARIHTAAYNSQNTGVMQSGNFDTRHYGTGTLSNGYGAIARCVNIGAGRINKAFGLGIDVGNYGGTIDSLWGIQIGGGSFGILTNANFAIGLHIGDMTANTAYGIWQGGNDDKNYFAGNSGLGTSSPINRLDINGGAVIGTNYSAVRTAPTNGLLVEGNVGINNYVGGAQYGSPAYQLSVNRYHTDAGSSTPLGLLAYNSGSSPNSGGGASLHFQTALGTYAAPTAVTSGALLGVIGFGGYDGTSFSLPNFATMEVRTTQAWTTTAKGTYMSFNTTPNGSTTSAERIRIDQNGNVGIGTTSPTQRLTVSNGTSTGTYTTTGWIHTSDERLKTNVRPLSKALDKVMAMQGVYFNWKATPNTDAQVGFIAQQVEPIVPEVVLTDDKGMKSMSYGNLTAVHNEAIKEQQKEIEALKQENAVLKEKLNELDALKEEVEKIKKAMKK